MTMPLRQVRSFVRREGRLTKGQQHALETLWPLYGVEYTATWLDLPKLFGRIAPVTLEIGFGNGQSLAEMARNDPGRDFLGVEVHRPGVGQLLQRIKADELSNVRVLCADAVEVLESMIPAGSLDRVQLFFPDPWPKKRHHKRRIVTPAFLDLVAGCLRPGGIFHMATDWEHYARAALEIIRMNPAFSNGSPTGNYCVRPGYRPLTKFEQRGQRLGHGVWDLLFERRFHSCSRVALPAEDR